MKERHVCTYTYTHKQTHICIHTYTHTHTNRYMHTIHLQLITITTFINNHTRSPYTISTLKEQACECLRRLYVSMEQLLVLLVTAAEVLQECVCQLHYISHIKVISLGKRQGR